MTLLLPLLLEGCSGEPPAVDPIKVPVTTTKGPDGKTVVSGGERLGPGAMGAESRIGSAGK